MKKFLFLLLTFSLVADAQAGDHKLKYQKDPSFEKLQTLIGTWESDGKKLTYELTSGGTVMMERLFPNTPHEMVTIYTDNGKVTHYCSMGNQPEMKLKDKTENSLTYEMKGKKGISSKNEPHIHGLTIIFEDKDHLTQKWVSYNKGKAEKPLVMQWTRVL